MTPATRKDEPGLGYSPATGMSENDFARDFGRRISFARQLRQLRRRDGEDFTQEWLARRVSELLHLEPPLRSATVSRWELGQSVPDGLKVMAAAIALEVDPGWLHFGRGSTATPPYEADLGASFAAVDRPRDDALSPNRQGTGAVAPAPFADLSERAVTRRVNLAADSRPPRSRSPYRATPAPSSPGRHD